MEGSLIELTLYQHKNVKSHTTPIQTESTDQTTPIATDTPGVLIFPPLLPVGTLLLSVALNFIWPLHLPGSIWIKVAAGVLFICGIALAGWGHKTMVRAGTNVPPNKPTLLIVTNGPFRFTRNPLYIGGTCVYLALTLVLNLGWALIFLVPMLLVLNWGIVAREERYLEKKFGAPYIAYKASVPRWIF